MKAFLIAPDHGSGCATVSAVDVRADADEGGAQLAHLYELLDCDMIEIVEVAEPELAGHVLVVDEEGLLKPQAGYLFMPRLYPTPLAGKVLVLGRGAGDDGEDRLCEASADEDTVRAAVGRSYCSPQFARVALRIHEDLVRKRFPDAIVIPASEYIRTV